MGSFGFWRQHIPHSSFGSYSGTFTERPKELQVLSEAQNRGKALQQVQDAVQATLPLGPPDPADAMVLGVSLANRDAVWSLQQAPIGELQCGPFRFWSKAHHPLQITTLLLRRMPQPASGPYRD